MHEDYRMDTISPRKVKTLASEDDLLDAFGSLASDKYDALVEFFTGEAILFIVNDMDRATPTAWILSCLDRYLKEGTGKGLGEHDISYLVASGSHVPPTPEEQRGLLGKHWEEGNCLIHDAKNGKHEHLFTTSRKTPVMIDSQLTNFKKVIVINSVEPHYFAGYTGGRKSFVPGIAAYETIQANHTHAMSDKSHSLALKDNPVHEDMMEATQGTIERLGLDVLAIQSVLSGSDIYSVAAGNIFSTQDRLLGKANTVFCAPTKGFYDIVLARTASPQDAKLYQALKSFENGKIALKSGGILILEAKCDKGIGPSVFFDLLTSSRNPAEIVARVKESYTLGAHKSTNLLQFLEENTLYIVSELDDEVVETCFSTPFKTVDDALAGAVSAMKEKGVRVPRILEILEANNVVPLVE